MRKLLVSVAIATATIATAVPAAAQAQQHRPAWNHGGPSRAQVANLIRDLNQAENGIQRAQQRRIISPREATGLRREAAQIRQRLTRASRNGINQREFASLRVQVNRLEQRLRHERRDRNGRRF